MTATPMSTRFRRRPAAALAAVTVGAVALLIPLQSGASADPVPAARVAAAAPVSTVAGNVTLTVDPASGLTAGGATLKVRGTGFNTAVGLYIAICHADGGAPASLKDCVGGAIPNSNSTTSWAHISKPGQAGVRWAGGGEVGDRRQLRGRADAAEVRPGLGCAGLRAGPLRRLHQA